MHSSFMCMNSAPKNRHFKNFFENFVENLQNGFASEEYDVKYLPSLCSDKALKSIECSQSTMWRWSLACRDMIQINLSVSYNIDELDYLSLSLSYKDSLTVSSKKDDKAFKSFKFLSFDKWNLSPENIKSWGNNDIRPIIMKSGCILDHFPSTQIRSFDGLSTFCFPHGLSMRIIPKCTIENAKKLG